MKHTALTLGKFAPLHRGHQLLIETALAENDEVLVMVYDCPGTTSVPLEVRARWIRDLYPAAEVLQAWDGPCEVGGTPELKRRHEDYILARLGGRRVTRFYSSEFYGDHVSKALGAEDRRIDPDRGRFPVSGTAIREDPYAHRHFIHPRVYRDLITNAVFAGAPSTGKTTLAERMAEEYLTVWMPEYGREYWEKHQVDRRLSLTQLVEIAEGHLEREDRRIHDARGYLFTDTNAITTYMFSLDYHGTAHPRLAELAAQAQERYDLVFLCGTDIPYDDTWDRSGAVHRQEFQERIEADLNERGLAYHTLEGSLEQRVTQVNGVLGGFRKYGPPAPREV